MPRRYRVTFVATFKHVVIADSSDVALRIARELADMPNIAMGSASEPPSCAWNTIEPLTDEDPV